jgi:hypothetical protein
MERRCGECTLCCTLLPVVALKKKGGERCINQRGLGCKVHDKEGFPVECKLWNCRWLIDKTTTKLLRPDISHYVIDIMPDFVTAHNNGREVKVPVLQVWIDPRHPHAHRDPNFREWVRQHEPECAVLCRYNEMDAILLIPPHMSDKGQWEERGSDGGPGMTIENRTHRADEIAAVLTNSGAMK